jgi:hypothetical protein
MLVIIHSNIRAIKINTGLLVLIFNLRKQYNIINVNKLTLRQT